MDTNTSRELVPDIFDSWIPVFKTGTHVDSQGNERSWNDDDLDAIITNFQPNTFTVPVVLGHQTADFSPAQGWVADLKKKAGILYAKLANVLENFSKSVKDKQYPNRSVGIDITEQGPVLRHLAFLGAVPPAIDLPPILQFKRYISSHVYSLPFESEVSTILKTNADTDDSQPTLKVSSDLNALSDAISKISSTIEVLRGTAFFPLKNLLNSLNTGDTPMPATYAAPPKTTGLVGNDDKTKMEESPPFPPPKTIPDKETAEMAAPPFPPKKPMTEADNATMAKSEFELPILPVMPSIPTSPPPSPPPSPATNVPPGMVIMTEAERNMLLSQSNDILSQGIVAACDAIFSSAKLYIEQLKAAGKITPAIVDELAEFICFLEKLDSPNPIVSYAAQTGRIKHVFASVDSSGRRVQMRPVDFFKKFLAGLPTQVQIGRQSHDYSAAVPSISPEQQAKEIAAIIKSGFNTERGFIPQRNAVVGG